MEIVGGTATVKVLNEGAQPEYRPDVRLVARCYANRRREGDWSTPAQYASFCTQFAATLASGDYAERSVNLIIPYS